MSKETGPQYRFDDSFKAAARLHQSTWRAKVLGVECGEFGNRLTEADGRALLNYYHGMGVREALSGRYPDFSAKRDCDLLRSEHIPFNMLSPLSSRPTLMQQVLKQAFGIHLSEAGRLDIEWAPSPAAEYLGDQTSFDVYIEGTSQAGQRTGVGIEVKYTERGYRIGTSEAQRVRDPHSTYWTLTRESGVFENAGAAELATDELRQIWRNHLLGLSMMRHGDIERFVSITLYPAGNVHFTHAISHYRSLLLPSGRDGVRCCTFEHYIDSLTGDSEVEAWKKYLEERYVVKVAVGRAGQQ